MAAVNPSEPSQPSLDTAYEVEGNPASKEPAQQAAAQSNSNDNSARSDQRVPSQQTASSDEATPTSMARGVRGAGPGEDSSKLTDQEQGKSADVDAAQMGAPGEGRVADAVKGTAPGSGGSQPGHETDLDRKKAEQAPAREKKKEEQRKEVDVGGVLGQRGGPANPVDRGNYNKSS